MQLSAPSAKGDWLLMHALQKRSRRPLLGPVLVQEQSSKGAGQASTMLRAGEQQVPEEQIGSTPLVGRRIFHTWLLSETFLGSEQPPMHAAICSMLLRNCLCQPPATHQLPFIIVIPTHIFLFLSYHLDPVVCYLAAAPFFFCALAAFPRTPSDDPVRPLCNRSQPGCTLRCSLLGIGGMISVCVRFSGAPSLHCLFLHNQSTRCITLPPRQLGNGQSCV
ncbi:unnamed protein product [Periconia digitata]|uniref:Uncharacterized protein n=1 Tax=Periconia digitata TaxID=1303443 RepID=A0A9W4XKW7_9PLEO|nr:unnamed protein product [Periconia digitata]